jgi:hypothetical protein
MGFLRNVSGNEKPWHKPRQKPRNKYLKEDYQKRDKPSRIGKRKDNEGLIENSSASTRSALNLLYFRILRRLPLIGLAVVASSFGPVFFGAQGNPDSLCEPAC